MGWKYPVWRRRHQKPGPDDALGNAEYRTWGGFCQFFSMANQRDGFGNHDKNTCRGYGHSREGTRAESISKNSDKKLLCYEINGNKRKRQNILDFQQGRYVLSLFYSVAKIEINRYFCRFHEYTGFEPVASTMRMWRAPNCANTPYENYITKEQNFKYVF